MALFSKPDCQDCKNLHELKGTEPRCSECLPEIYPENIEAIKIWGLVSDQRIWVGGGMSAPVSVGLQHLPIWRLIDEFQIEDRLTTFIKVLNIYEHISGIEREKSGR